MDRRIAFALGLLVIFIVIGAAYSVEPGPTPGEHGEPGSGKPGIPIGGPAPNPSNPYGEWEHKVEITIENPTGASLSGYPVMLEVPYVNGMNFDFSDIRFTDEYGTPLNYYIDDNSTPDTAYVWVKIPYIGPNSNTTIYLYYGNPNAISESNPYSVFDLYDDFSSFDYSKWSTSNGYVSTYGNYICFTPSSSSASGIYTQDYYSIQDHMLYVKLKAQYYYGDNDISVGWGTSVSNRFVNAWLGDEYGYSEGYSRYAQYGNFRVDSSVIYYWGPVLGHTQYSDVYIFAKSYNIFAKFDWDSVKNTNTYVSETNGRVIIEVDGYGGFCVDKVVLRKYDPTFEANKKIVFKSTWKYQQEIEISNPTDIPLYNVPVKIDPSQYNYQDMAPTEKDARFFTLSGQKLPYYYDSLNNVFIVRVPYIPAHGSVKIKMRFGNPFAQSESDEKAKYSFFQRFEDTSLQEISEKWEHVAGAYSLSGNYLVLHGQEGTARLVTKEPIGTPNLDLDVVFYGGVDTGTATFGIETEDGKCGYYINETPFSDDQTEVKLIWKDSNGETVIGSINSRVYIHNDCPRCQDHEVEITSNGVNVYLENGYDMLSDNENRFLTEGCVGPLHFVLQTTDETLEVSDISVEQSTPQTQTTFGDVESPLYLVDKDENDINIINYWNESYGYLDVDPNAYVKSDFTGDENVSLIYGNSEHSIRISNIVNPIDSFADVDINPLYAMYPGRIKANVSGKLLELSNHPVDLGYFITKYVVDKDNNKLNITVLSFDHLWRSIDAYLSEQNVSKYITKPKIIFSLYDQDGNKVFETLIKSNSTVSIDLPENFNDKFRFYYNDFYSDTVAPTIEFTSDLANSFVYSIVHELGSTIEDQSNITEVNLTIDGVPYSMDLGDGPTSEEILDNYINNYYPDNLTFSFYKDALNIGEGNHTLKITAKDIYGNVGNYSTWFEVYLTPGISIEDQGDFVPKYNEIFLNKDSIPIKITSITYTENGSYIIPLIVSEKDEMQEIESSSQLMAYTIDTKALIDAGILNENCSNFDVYTMYNQPVPHKLLDCGSAHAKLLVYPKGILYVKILPKDESVDHNADLSKLRYNLTHPAFDNILDLNYPQISNIDENGYFAVIEYESGKPIHVYHLNKYGITEVYKTSKCGDDYLFNGGKVKGGQYPPYVFPYKGSEYVLFYSDNLDSLMLLNVSSGKVYTLFKDVHLGGKSSDGFLATVVGNTLAVEIGEWQPVLVFYNLSSLKMIKFIDPGVQSTVAFFSYGNRLYLIGVDKEDYFVMHAYDEEGREVYFKQYGTVKQYGLSCEYPDLPLPLHSTDEPLVAIKDNNAYFVAKCGINCGEGTIYSPVLFKFNLNDYSFEAKEVPFGDCNGDYIDTLHAVKLEDDGNLTMFVDLVSQKRSAAVFTLNPDTAAINDYYDLVALEGGEVTSTAHFWKYNGSIIFVSDSSLGGRTEYFFFNVSKTAHILRSPYLPVGNEEVDTIKVKFTNLNTGDTYSKIYTNNWYVEVPVNDLPAGRYLMEVFANNTFGRWTKNYYEFIYDTESPTITASWNPVEVNGETSDVGEVSYSIMDNFQLKKCTYHVENEYLTTEERDISCGEGKIELRYPEIIPGEDNRVYITAEDYAGNQFTYELDISPDCLLLPESLNEINWDELEIPTFEGKNNFFLVADVSVCPGTYHINYTIKSTDTSHPLSLNLTGVTLIGDGKETKFDSGIIETAIKGDEYLQNTHMKPALCCLRVYGGNLTNFDVAAFISDLHGTKITNSNIGVLSSKAEAVSLENVNVPFAFSLMYNSTVDGLPVILLANDLDEEGYMYNYTEISPATIGFDKVGGIIISGWIMHPITIRNLTVVGGGIDRVLSPPIKVYDTPYNITVSNNTFDNVGVVILYNGTFESNIVNHTKGAELFADMKIINNYFNNTIDDISAYSGVYAYAPLEYHADSNIPTNLILSEELNCSKTSIVGGCYGGNRWSKYSGEFDPEKKIGLRYKIIQIYMGLSYTGDPESTNYSSAEFVDLHPLYADYPTFVETEPTNRETFTSTFGTSGGYAKFNVSGITKYEERGKINVLTVTPPVSDGDTIYFISTGSSNGTMSVHLVRYNLISNSIVWESNVLSPVLVNKAFYVNGGQGNVVRPSNIVSTQMAIPNIMFNGKYVCVLPANERESGVSCFDKNTGDLVLYIPPKMDVDVPNPEIENAKFVATDVQQAFTMYGDTIYFVKSDGSQTKLCKYNLSDPIDYKCNYIDTAVWKYYDWNEMPIVSKPALVYNPNESLLYLIIQTDKDKLNVLGVDADTLNTIYTLTFNDALYSGVANPIIFNDTLYFIYKDLNAKDYKLVAFKDGVYSYISIGNFRPTAISMFDGKIVISEAYNLSFGSIVFVDPELGVSNIKYKLIGGMPLQATGVNGMLYVPIVRFEKETGVFACGEEPSDKYVVGLVAYNESLQEVWEYDVKYPQQYYKASPNPKIGGEEFSNEIVPMPFAVVPNDKLLLLPVIHYLRAPAYANEDDPEKIFGVTLSPEDEYYYTPIMGLKDYATTLGTIYILTEAPKTCNDIPNSDGLHCTFNWSAPHHGYINDSGDGICYMNECHPSCDPADNTNFGNPTCISATSGNWIYCCGSDSLYQICIDDTQNCPKAQLCGNLYQPCCQPGNTCNSGLHCGCSPSNATAVCLPSGEGFSIYSNSLWGNWGAFLYNNQACCASGWENIVIS